MDGGISHTEHESRDICIPVCGVPDFLHTDHDQGRNFESALLKAVCTLLGVSKTRTSPYHPQSDGLIERFTEYGN